MKNTFETTKWITRYIKINFPALNVKSNSNNSNEQLFTHYALAMYHLQQNLFQYILFTAVSPSLSLTHTQTHTITAVKMKCFVGQLNV